MPQFGAVLRIFILEVKNLKIVSKEIGKNSYYDKKFKKTSSDIIIYWCII